MPLSLFLKGNGKNISYWYYRIYWLSYFSVNFEKRVRDFCNRFIRQLFFKINKKALLILEGLNIDAKNILHFFKGNLKNLNDIENTFQISHKLNKKIEAVIHFAGLKSVSESILEPISYWDSK